MLYSRLALDVLMMPVDVGLAVDLGRLMADPTPLLNPDESNEAMLELIPGIAAREDAQDRQSIAFAAAVGIYSQSSKCEARLAHHVVGLYQAKE
jgi:hypothetical protein